MKHVVRSGELQEIDDNDEDIDFELLDSGQLFSPHLNSIPNQANVQTARQFYGARFFNQAFAVENGEQPLVQNLATFDKNGRSYDDLLGEHLGAKRADEDGVVKEVTPDYIRIKTTGGETKDISIYNHQYFNQKSGNHSRPLVKPGDQLKRGQLVAASIYTDDKGTQSMGLNARIGLVPWKGFSIDDAMPISESFAKRLSAIQYKVVTQGKDDNLKTGLNHYRALFPNRFPAEKLKNFDDTGVVKPGTILEPGDPVVLATMPRTISSSGVNVGKLSKALRQERRDAAEVWDGSQPAEVVRAVMTRNGPKVVLRFIKPTAVGDKVTLRAGAKATVSRIIPDDQMPRTADGQPLDAMLNPLSLKSRANLATFNELRLAKIAKKTGQPMKIPSFLPKGQSWQDFIDKLEAEHGVSAEEEIFDPELNKKLEQPVLVGYGFIQKLHHTSESKSSARGIGSYDQNEQPAKGSSEMAQAKRHSGLENYATLSSGAYGIMRDNTSIRGAKNHEYWKAMREGKPLPKPGTPFVFNKFRALLTGAGMKMQDQGKGKFRLRPFVDEDLDEVDAVEVENGDIIRLTDMSPVKGGLFDSRLTVGNKWGRIRLPRPVPNPAMEDAIKSLLGLSGKDYEDILDGRLELPEHLR